MKILETRVLEGITLARYEVQLIKEIYNSIVDDFENYGDYLSDEHINLLEEISETLNPR